MKPIKTIIYPLLGMLLLSIGFIFFSFTYSSIESISIKNLEKKVITFEQEEKDVLDLEKKSKDWQNIDKSYSRFKNEFLLKFEELSTFRNELQSILRKNSLRLQNIRFQYVPVLKNEIEKAVIYFDLEGFYKDIKKFIFEIEKMDKIIIFKNIKLNKTKSHIAGKITLEVYFVS